MNLKDKTIVLAVSGGIAAYKSVELLRLMIRQGASVRVIMTANACAFVAPLTFEALSGNKVCRGLFEEDRDASIQHIEWARQADAVVVAPATANIIGKLAGGIADDALSTLMLAVTVPVLVCPSMNTHMYRNRAVLRNLERLRDDGYTVLEPGTGELACGTSGAGRMPEPDIIVNRLLRLLSPDDLTGKKVLVTAGPTREPIDPVRFISNRSSGKMGYALAMAAEFRGARVTLVSGPTGLEPPLNVELVPVQTAADMADTVLSRLEEFDVIVKVAAVGDYRVTETAAHKIKKESAEAPTLRLSQNPDILKEISRKKRRRTVVAGFAAETRHLEENARKKLAEKDLDLIIVNQVAGEKSAFDADDNQVHLFFKDGREEPLPRMAKTALADLIWDRLRDLMA
ncbi:MAG: bifunctional phosphopantothenoylcysteine decarboxylase/phosphopantothenate--cysteine ligase CoaBC [Desulfosudaceae bacterium]